MSRSVRIAVWLGVVLFAAYVISKFSSVPQTFLPEGKCAVFWHAKERCEPCRKLEKIFDTVSESRTQYRLIKLEYDAPQNQQLAAELHIGTATVALVEVRNYKIVRKRDLTKEIWNLLEKEQECVKMLADEFDTF